MRFEFYPLRFEFVARDSIHFPQGKPANILRGAFGSVFHRIACIPSCEDPKTCDFRAECPYARIFEPVAIEKGPSGLLDLPRPFVFRARHLDDQFLAVGDRFFFDVHIFAVHNPAVAYFAQTFSTIAREGLGPRRGRAELLSISILNRPAPFPVIHDGRKLVCETLPSPVSIPLTQSARAVASIRVDFLSPTELKSSQQVAARPEFPILLARIRDRLSMLRKYYGSGSLDVDFKGLGERAKDVQMTRCDINSIDVRRQSSRTGQVHSLGGFVGCAEYTGPLDEFMPFLEAGRWIGVGRQTVWGKGEISTRVMA